VLLNHSVLIIRSARYIQSCPTIAACPKPDKAEFAFIGRSNVGKSSLINMLTSNGKLAQVSSRPGKTKMINHFLINDGWYLVDLPGYGYAAISQTQRDTWQRNLEEYLQKRENLQNVFLLVDANIPPQKKDIEFAEWLGEHHVPFSIIFTKADKPKTNALQQNIAAFKREMLKSWAQLPPMFITSLEKQRGRDDILSYIENCINTYEPQNL
jgi:GTP-binding protein